jgi:hypothetical protein
MNVRFTSEIMIAFRIDRTLHARRFLNAYKALADDCCYVVYRHQLMYVVFNGEQNRYAKLFVHTEIRNLSPQSVITWKNNYIFVASMQPRPARRPMFIGPTRALQELSKNCKERPFLKTY